MTSTRTTLCFTALLLALGGCGGGTTDDAGMGGNDAAAGSDAAAGDAGGTDAGSTDAGSMDAGSTDAGATDGGGTDAAVAPDGGGCAMCLASTYEFGADGGFVAERRRSRVDPCQDFEHTRTNFASGGTMRMCGSTIPSCDDTTGAVTVDDLVRAFAHPDVVAAFAAGTVLYGRDTRPVDGQVFQIQEVGAGLIEIGSDCSGAPGCAVVPAGVAALRTLLGQLETQQLARPDCSTVFTP